MVNEIKEKVRYLRKNQTEAESLLWDKLRNRQVVGCRFIRQYPITMNYEGKSKLFIADFYCAKKKLIIEVDGKIHEQQKEQDELRTYLINTKGIKVVRFTNDEIINNINNVIIRLKVNL